MLNIPNQNRFRGPWTFWEMLNFPAERFLAAFNGLCAFRAALTEYQRRNKTTIASSGQSAEIRSSHARELREIFSAIGANRLENRAKELEVFLSKWPIKTDTSIRMISRLIESIEYEFGDSYFIAVDKAQYDQHIPLLGENIQDKFLDCSFDIDEASKCLAMERYTACAFHLMRVVERALHSVRECLGIPEPQKDSQRNWGVVLRQINDEIERRDKSDPSGWKDRSEKKLISKISRHIELVENAFRNETMHIETKYTEEEALHILAATRQLMKTIANRMDQDASPSA